ncbi:MAG: ribulose-phosphate 3-epimerase [Actinobacteria bacterium]|nr:ribulose-phosphate 3-epimerase [Actinomycetota bacterium]
MESSIKNLKNKIGASLACADQLNLSKEIDQLIEAGIDFLHIDIMDGIYVNNYCFGTQLFDYLKRYKILEIDVHLMVVDPYYKIDFFKNINFKRLSFHIETCKNPIQTIDKIKKKGIECGIALNVSTSHNILEYLYNDIDYVMIMAVEAGFAGQDFRESTIDKVRIIREEFSNRKMNKDIYVDGHIDFYTISKLFKAGANVFIGGTAGIFNGKNSYRENILRLRNAFN